MKKVLFGIDVLKTQRPAGFTGKRLGLLSNHASYDGARNRTKDVIRTLYGEGLKALFSPQHGFYGVEQDNMRESSHIIDERLEIPIFSLYADKREPTDEMLDKIDTLIVDLVDVGTRVYTFIYTMALCMKRAGEIHKKVIVLDRPNPIANVIEGNIVTDDLTSFVGMYPIPMRHGLTIGEMALLFNWEYKLGCDLSVVKMEGYESISYYDETGHKFPFPSPNMPTLDSAIVYPGQVIFEGTNVSEGRGTTRPFEMFGAPFIDPHKLKASLEKHDIKGVAFSQIYFKPVFNKYADEVCGGLSLHVTDRRSYRPYITSLIILGELMKLYPDEVKFTETPYEYEYDKLPFDIITGDSAIRKSLYEDDGAGKILELFNEDEDAFKEISQKHRLY